uniref:Uncharacterized protein n=1 Tax=Anguilla anguilla TaxID=7936 RepID=A0A0E9T2U1_ANGAN
METSLVFSPLVSRGLPPISEKQCGKAAVQMWEGPLLSVNGE